MPIDLIKKSAGQKRTVNLRRRKVYNKKNKDLEEKLENKFSELSAIAARQKIKIIWFTTICCSAVLVTFWFYLASQGVIISQEIKKSRNQGIKDNSQFDISREIVSGFQAIKKEFKGPKDIINNLKNQLVVASVQQDVVNSLKENLQQQFATGDNSQKETADKIISDSGNLILTYPLSNYYIDNPVKILGNGAFFEAVFLARLKSGDGKILGQVQGMSAEGETMSPFSVNLNYISSDSENGVLEVYTLSPKDGAEQDLVNVPVKFIVGLQDWQVYKNEEQGFEIKYPKDWVLAKESNKQFIEIGTILSLQSPETIQPLEEKKIDHVRINNLTISYWTDINNQYAKGGSWVGEKRYDNLRDYFTDTKAPKHEIGEILLNGQKFYEVEIGGYGSNYGVMAEHGGVYEISFERAGDKTDLEKLEQQILATFKFIEPDLEKWQDYQDTTGEVAFKYPQGVSIAEDSGQITFRSEDPDGFSFYLFTMEPEIDNLNSWVKESLSESGEKIIKNEIKSFGDAVDGVYYETEKKTDSELTPGDEQTENERSLNYLFNHLGVTYSIRTNKGDFPRTFESMLDSIKFKTQDGTLYDEILKQE